MRTAVREAQFAGSWYPSSPDEAAEYWKPSQTRQRALAVICPHAGWMYSGHVAGDVYGRIQPADTFVVLGPNHTGQGRSMTSLFASGHWTIQNREVPIDEELAADLLHFSEFIAEDPEAHAGEHSIEVQVPFLLFLNPLAKLVPIVMRDYDPEIFHDVGRSLASACQKRPEDRIVLVASTDMTHYESQERAKRQDRAAIERMTALDADGLHQIVGNLNITMCGLGPAASVITAARSLGATAAELVRYATSGDVTKDEESVVGYAGLVIH